MLTREQIMAMDHSELKVEIAERIFKAKVIGKEGHPNDFLLVGFMSNQESSLMPMSGRRWQDAWWRDSAEKAWLDIPDYAESMEEAWKVLEKFRPNVDWIGVDTFAKGYRCIIMSDERVALDGFGETAPEAICRAALLSTLEV